MCQLPRSRRAARSRPTDAARSAGASSPTTRRRARRSGRVTPFPARTGPPEDVGRHPVLYGPAGAAAWSAPTIDLKRGRLYVATSDAYTLPAAETTDAVVAMDLKTGRIVWSKQTTPNDAYLTGTCLQAVNTAGRSEQCPNPLGPDFDFGSRRSCRRTTGSVRRITLRSRSRSRGAASESPGGVDRPRVGGSGQVRVIRRRCIGPS